MNLQKTAPPPAAYHYCLFHCLHLASYESVVGETERKTVMFGHANSLMEKQLHRSIYRMVLIDPYAPRRFLNMRGLSS